MVSEIKQAHRRMLKVPLRKPRMAFEGESSDIRHIVAPRQQTVTETVRVAETGAATASATSTPGVSDGFTIPTSTAAVAGVAGFLGLILILTAVGCFYRRRKLATRTSNKHKAPSASFDFGQSSLFEKKNPFAAATLENPLHVDLSPSLSPRIAVHTPATPSTASSTVSSSEESGWRSPASGALRVKNADRLTAMPALPKAAAEKRRPSQRLKASWTTHGDELVGSPPPAYDFAGAAQGFLFPIPSQLPPEKGRATPTPPTPPATRKEHRVPSLRKGKKAAANLHALVVPVHDIDDGPEPVASPARSESFAPKELAVPPPIVPSPAGSSGSGAQGSATETSRTPRMMTVVAPYIPTLADELRVSVGDTVRLMQEYKDGWGFVQYVGKADAPKGVVPLVCLQERRNMVPTVSHRAPNSGSIGSINSSTWR